MKMSDHLQASDVLPSGKEPQVTTGYEVWSALEPIWTWWQERINSLSRIRNPVIQSLY